MRQIVVEPVCAICRSGRFDLTARASAARDPARKMQQPCMEIVHVYALWTGLYLLRRRAVDESRLQAGPETLFRHYLRRMADP